MKHAPLAVLFGVVFLSSLPSRLIAQSPGLEVGVPWGVRDAAPGVWSGWQAFLAEQAPAAWTSRICRASGTPKAIYGAGLGLSAAVLDSAAARRQAVALLDRYANLLGRGRSEFRESIYGHVNRTHILVFDQYYRGLPVLDGRADLRIKDHGVVAMLGSQAFAIPAGFTIRPSLSAQAVRRALASRFLDASPRPAGAAARLLIWADAQLQRRCQPRLAWELRVATPTRVGRVYVDAHSGVQLGFRSDRHGVRGLRHRPSNPVAGAAPVTGTSRSAVGRASVVGTVRGYANDSIRPNAALRNLPMPGLRVSVQGGNWALTDANGRFSIPHAGVAPVTVVVTFAAARRVSSVVAAAGTAMQVRATLTPGIAGQVQIYAANATAFERSQSTAYYLTHRVAEYVRAPHILGRHQLLNRLDDIKLQVNDPLLRCNAQYSGNQVRFAQAFSTCVNTAYSTLVEHEWGHGLDEVFGGISAHGGLSEGWADVVAVFATGQPLIGMDFITTGYFLRTGNNRRQYPNGLFLHQQGESWLGGCWQTRQALIAKLGAVAGVRHAETIILGSLLANAATQPDALREVYMLDDDDGNLNNGSPNCRELLQSFTGKHNIPSPVRCSQYPGRLTIYGTGCPGTNGKDPGFDVAAIPEIGWPFQLRVSSARPGSTAVVLAGFSDAKLGGFILPLDLTSFSAKGCTLLNSAEVLMLLPINSMGTATLSGAVPNLRASLGQTVYLQAAVLDPGANGLGLVFSRGIAAQIGSR